jgi:hypothetical protein
MALLPSFPKEISDQVKVRQEKLNFSNSLTNEDILFRNNAGAFIRLTSGIDVTSDIIKSLGLNGIPAGSNLAKRYKLFSARFQRKIGEDKNKNDVFAENFSQGVGYSISYPTSYGFTSSPEFGYTPPPGITNISVKTTNYYSPIAASLKYYPLRMTSKGYFLTLVAKAGIFLAVIFFFIFKCKSIICGNFN